MIEKVPVKVLPPHFPYSWCSDWGEDDYGIFMAFTYKDVTQYFRWIQPGEFMMGSPENEPERLGNEYLHKVILTEGFWLAETACTQELWEAVMGTNPAYFKGANRPVELISWDDCRLFMDKVNKLIPELSLRLPTEAEWEYACRAGTITPFSFGENITPEQVNYNGKNPYNNGKKGKNRNETVEVRSLPPNPWGLYEMHGNVWEWCSDWFDTEYYENSPLENPQGPESGDSRVLRGGSWVNLGRFVRSAIRFGYAPGSRINSFGFRLARGRTRRALR